MQTLLWPDELRGTEGIVVPYAEPPHQQELQMARSLMDAVTADFRLEEEHDAYRHALEQVVACRLEAWSRPVPPIPCRSKLDGGPGAERGGSEVRPPYPPGREGSAGEEDGEGQAEGAGERAHRLSAGRTSPFA
ncbi:hypothetical protein BGM19_01245 [Streptomyces agglomeratus]|nr:hypothetical protein BGM19_01245 [Streptomyces agglomeratus]